MFGNIYFDGKPYDRLGERKMEGAHNQLSVVHWEGFMKLKREILKLTPSMFSMELRDLKANGS